MIRLHRFFLLLIFLVSGPALPAQTWHPQAHAHNDYVHIHPLTDALANGFTSVEADVHLYHGALLVAHDSVRLSSPTLETTYLRPLDSLLTNRKSVFSTKASCFLLMIDIKTEPESTWKGIRQLLSTHPTLMDHQGLCPFTVFISGNRPRAAWNEGDPLLILDGRPSDLGKGISPARMPVISDHYANWCLWKGTSNPEPGDLQRISMLADKVHAEGKKLRLWAIPDQEVAWQALLDAGVDLISTDRLEALNHFLSNRKVR